MSPKTAVEKNEGISDQYFSDFGLYFSIVVLEHSWKLPEFSINFIDFSISFNFSK